MAAAHGEGPSTYVEGERVFGPPLGTYDADWVAAAAQQGPHAPDPATAQALSRAAWAHLRTGATTVDALAARLREEHPEGAAADVVARAALDYCAAYGVDLPG